jgi:archaellum biogenesis ATPase FlaH
MLCMSVLIKSVLLSQFCYLMLSRQQSAWALSLFSQTDEILNSLRTLSMTLPDKLTSSRKAIQNRQVYLNQNKRWFSKIKYEFPKVT